MFDLSSLRTRFLMSLAVLLITGVVGLASGPVFMVFAAIWIILFAPERFRRFGLGVALLLAMVPGVPIVGFFLADIIWKARPAAELYPILNSQLEGAWHVSRIERAYQLARLSPDGTQIAHYGKLMLTEYITLRLTFAMIAAWIVFPGSIRAALEHVVTRLGGFRPRIGSIDLAAVPVWAWGLVAFLFLFVVRIDLGRLDSFWAHYFWTAIVPLAFVIASISISSFRETLKSILPTGLLARRASFERPDPGANSAPELNDAQEPT